MTPTPKHLKWFDDSPKPRSGRGAKKTGKPVRAAALASALPRPVRHRPNPPRPAKAAGLGGKPPRSIFGAGGPRVPRRLAIPALSASLPRRTLASRLKTR